MPKRAARDLFWILAIEVCLELGIWDLGIPNSVARLFFLRDSRECLSILATTGKSRRILNGTLDLVIIFFGPFLVSLFTETSYLFTNCSLRANQIYFTVLPPVSIMARKVLSFSLVRTRPAHSY